MFFILFFLKMHCNKQNYQEEGKKLVPA